MHQPMDATKDYANLSTIGERNYWLNIGYKISFTDNLADNHWIYAKKTLCQPCKKCECSQVTYVYIYVVIPNAQPIAKKVRASWPLSALGSWPLLYCDMVYILALHSVDLCELE